MTDTTTTTNNSADAYKSLPAGTQGPVASAPVTAIAPSQLSPATPMATVPPPVDNTNYNSISTPITQSIMDEYSNLNNKQNTAQNNQSDLATQITSLIGESANKAKDIQDAQNSAGVNTANTDINSYTTQLAQLNGQASALNREAQAIPIQTQQRNANTGATDAGVAPQNTQALRDNALKALSIGQQADIAAYGLTGAKIRLDAANQKAQQIIDLKYAPIEAQLKAKQAQYTLNKDLLDSIDKKRSEALQVSLKKEAEDIADAKANAKQIQDLAINAAQQGAPQDLITKAQKAKSPMDAANILGVYAGDARQAMLINAQIRKINAETAKEVAKNSGGTFSVLGSNVTAPNGDAINGLPDEYMKAIAKTKLNESQGNAVAFVTRMIQSDKAIKDQVGQIRNGGQGTSNPFLNETKGYDPTSLNSSIGRLVNSDNSREYSRNAEDFIRAQLRKESGASIAPDELAGGQKLYTSIGAGKDAKDIVEAQKKRDVAIKSMITQAGPAAPLLLQYYNNVKNGTLGASSADNAAQKIIDAHKQINNTPQGLNLFDN